VDEPTWPDSRLDGPVDQMKSRTARYHAIVRVHVLDAHAGVVHRQRSDLPYAGGECFGADLSRPGDGGEGLTNACA
jgi:hypothetical protein